MKRALRWTLAVAVVGGLLVLPANSAQSEMSYWYQDQAGSCADICAPMPPSGDNCACQGRP